MGSLRCVLIAFLVVGLSNLSYAQLSDSDYLIKYKEAVQTYASHNFDEAIVELAPLTSSDYKNVMQPYAMYYYALSAHEAKKYFQAREMLRSLFTRYPNWEKLDDAYYLYSNSNFAEGYYEEALNSNLKILDPELKLEVKKMTSHYVSDIKEINQLKKLNSQFPNNEFVAKQLVKQIQSRPYNTKDDLELSDLLTNRFKLKDEKKAVGQEGNKVDFSRSYDDATLDFGVLLPFDVEEASQNEIKYQYAYDIYVGMKMAEKNLNSEGIPVRVFGFDVGADPLGIKEHVEDPNFKSMDVLFGPLYARPNRIIKSYVEANSIIQVHPLSNNQSLVKEDPRAFLIQPSFETQAAAVVDFVSRQEWEKTCVIVHDGVRKNESLADAYEKQLIAEGVKVLWKSKLDLETTDPELEVENLGHILVIGENGFYSFANRTLGRFKIVAPFITNSNSVDLRTISRGTLNKELFILYPNFVDSQKNNVNDFDKAYINKMNMYPSDYTYLGYDMIMFFTKMLKDGKSIFRLNLNDSRLLDDFLTAGFDYSSGAKDNQRVPIVAFQNGGLEIVN